jgi:hypothetical protein
MAMASVVWGLAVWGLVVWRLDRRFGGLSPARDRFAVISFDQHQCAGDAAWSIY